MALGGDGNDIVTDLGGADVHKGGPGNDALDGGIGDDIFMGGDGQDFINGGANDNESFAGPGNDFVIAGQGADAVFGDGGDDWIQGGTGQDLLQGDHGAPFFDDPAETAPGNDIFIGQVGENDYDAEGGDDVMSQNAAVDRNAGAGGFDWAFHQYDTVGADDDMEINNNLVGVPIQVVVNRDRWQETEADSGSAFNDIIKGTSVAPEHHRRRRVHRLRRPRPGRCRPDQRPRPAGDDLPVAARTDRGRLGCGCLPTDASPLVETSGPKATSSSAVSAATRSTVVAPTTSSMATGPCRSRSVSAPTRPTRPPRSVPPT